jgi:hypothetical protein
MPNVQIKTMTSSRDKRQQDHQGVPLEIDTHYELYGKHAWEVQYG